MVTAFAQPVDAMRRALELAARGQGRVEPNPPVGAVIVDDQLRCIAEGYHARFGGPHAEICALEAAGDRARGGTLFVTLEPCAHFGKTPPCAPRVVAAGLRKVVCPVLDPAPHTRGRGLQLLRDAGVEVEVGLLAEEGARLIAPFAKLTTRGLPWVHAKWAMTLDGKLATRTGDSRWISSEASRCIVHQLRGRMDAIMVGIGTVLADDPLLTARPPRPRTAVRVIVDRDARLPPDSRLVRSLDQAPLIVAVGRTAPPERCDRLAQAGVEVLRLESEQDLSCERIDLDSLLKVLGGRHMTNVLVEGGSRLLGGLWDCRQIDEVHAFIAPCLVGGAAAPSPVAGAGIEAMAAAIRLRDVDVSRPGGDVYVHGFVPQEDA